VIAELTEVSESANLSKVDSAFDDLKKRSADQNVRIEVDSDTTGTACRNICQKYLKSILSEMNRRFSDDVGKIADVQETLRLKPESADFSAVSKIFDLPNDELEQEWRILRRLQCDLSTPSSLLAMCCEPEKVALFPTFSRLAKTILLLPIGTAGVERSPL